MERRKPQKKRKKSSGEQVAVNRINDDIRNALTDGSKKKKKKKQHARGARAKNSGTSVWQERLNAAARLRATATEEAQLAAVEKQLTKLITDIPEDNDESETWSKASSKLATLLLQSGRNLGLASSLLTELGYRYRLSIAALRQDHSRPELPPPGAAAAWDHALPPHLLTALSECFFPAAPFWSAHDYSDGSERPPTPYFSYVVPLTHAANDASLKKKRADKNESATTSGRSSCDDSVNSWSSGGGGAGVSVLIALIRHIQRVASEAVPGVMDATAAEWWCHSRPHSSGHQFHFDSDDEGRGGVRNPIISTVTYLSPAGIGGETLVTSQTATGTSLARVGHLCAGRRNRLLAFRGDLLHGVVPGAGCGSTHRKGRRVTFMVAFWKRITIQDKPGHGSARPFARFAAEPWAAPLVAPVARYEARQKKKELKDEKKKRLKTGGPIAKAKKTTPSTKPARGAFFRVPVWEDVDEHANALTGESIVEVAAGSTMPSYDAFFQFA